MDFSSLPPLDAPDLQAQRFIRDFNKAINSSQPRYVTALYVVEEVGEEENDYFIGGQLLMLGECIASLYNGNSPAMLGHINVKGRSLQVVSSHWLPSSGLRFPKTDMVSEKLIMSLRKNQFFIVDVPLYVTLENLERVRFAGVPDTDDGKAEYPTRIRPWTERIFWPPKFFAGITKYPDLQASISERNRNSWFRRDISKMTYMKNPAGGLFVFDTQWISAPDRLPFFAKWLQHWEWRESDRAQDRITRSREVLGKELELLHHLPGGPSQLPIDKTQELLSFYRNPYAWRSSADIETEQRQRLHDWAVREQAVLDLQKAKWVTPAAWKELKPGVNVARFSAQEGWVTVSVRSIERRRYEFANLKEISAERLGTNFTVSSSITRQIHGPWTFEVLMERVTSSQFPNIPPIDNSRWVAVLDWKENPTLVWLFEIVGRSQSVTESLPEFEKFLASIAFPDSVTSKK